MPSPLFVFLFGFLVSGVAPGKEISAVPGGGTPSDRRLEDPVTLHDYHPFRSVPSAEDWVSRQADIRDRILLASGLLPLPERTPLRAERFGRISGDGFVVEKVYFESFPGHFVTASLYRPDGVSARIGLQDGKRPGVLCPHGHWKDGRFYDLLAQRGEKAVLETIAGGEERFFASARNPIQARCVQLARMGCVVLQYDTIGTADSVQFAEHRRGPRPGMSGTEPGSWGFVSAQATLRLQTNFGLQNWNSIRALDFLLTLEDVDPDRILVTGASGGATQTMMLAAVDERVDAAFPCVMVSTAMQGGCTCENSHYLRIGQGNVDIAAAVAPRPLGLTAADDWTIELETKGHPDLKGLYEMVGAENAYEAHFDVHFKHNYNHVSRTHMYRFVNRHFDLGLGDPVLERDHRFLDRHDLTVWEDEREKPDNYRVGDEHERDVNRVWAELSDAALDTESARRAWSLILRRDYDGVGEAAFSLTAKEQGEEFLVMSGLIELPAEGEVVPSLFYYPEDWNGEVVFHLSRDGKDVLHEGDPLRPSEAVQAHLDKGSAVGGLDLFLQGEFIGDGEEAGNRTIPYRPGAKEPEPTSWQRSPVYFYGYNDSVFVRRVHDILTAVKMAQTSPKWDVTRVTLEGQPGTGHWIAAAVLAAGAAIDEFTIDLGGFRFASLDDVWHEDFVPGAVKYGDVEMLVELAGSE